MALPQGHQGGHSSDVSPLAGLFNLRGDDIPYNPVFYSYTLLTTTNIRWAVAAVGLTQPSSLIPLDSPPLPIPHALLASCSAHPIASHLQVLHLSHNQSHPSQ